MLKYIKEGSLITPFFLLKTNIMSIEEIEKSLSVDLQLSMNYKKDLLNFIKSQAKEIEELKEDLSDMSDSAEYHRIEEVIAKEENTQLKERVKELEGENKKLLKYKGIYSRSILIRR
jgi:DNA repair exonuclease SbcCD ATPase subunit